MGAITTLGLAKTISDIITEALDFAKKAKNAELAEIDGLRAFRRQIIIQKSMMADFIIRVICNVLRHVAVEHLQRGNVSRS